MSSQQKAPNVFTEAGEEWVNDFLDDLQANNEKQSDIYEKYDFTETGPRNENGRIPHEHSSYGELVETDKTQYLFTSLLSGDRDQITKKLGADADEPPNYRNLNFGRVRVYLEAKARGFESLFAPITGWDGQNFRWVTTREAVNRSRLDHKFRELIDELESDPAWELENRNFGYIDGDPVFFDYGMFWYDGNWKTTEAELFDDQDY